MTAAARSASAANHWLDALDAAGCAALLGAAADLLLVVDAAGRVLDVDTTLDTDTGIAFSSWAGRPLEQLLRAADRPRLRRLLTAARAGRGARRQVLAHVVEEHAPLFVEYAALALGTAGRVLLVGRDRSALAGLAAQLADERLARERARRDLRRAESRYQQLFDCLPGALLVVDAANQRVLEANDAAERLFERPAAALLGRPLAALFGRAQRARLAEWWAQPPGEALVLALGRARRSLRLAARGFGGGARALRVVELSLVAPVAAPQVDSRFMGLLGAATDAALLTDVDGRVQWANEAAVALCGEGDAEALCGQRIERLVTPAPVDMAGVLATLRHGRRHAGLTARLAGGAPVELTAVPLLDCLPPGFGFFLRPAAPRGEAPFVAADTLANLLAAQPLRAVVRDAADRVERQCIEATLRLTGNNRALAAKVLGMSRQGLYLKLHLYGLAGGEERPRDD